MYQFNILFDRRLRAPGDKPENLNTLCRNFRDDTSGGGAGLEVGGDVFRKDARNDFVKDGGVIRRVTS